MTTKKAALPKKTPGTAKRSTTKKKYIESHWLFFSLQGIVALSFGIYALFTGITDVPTLMIITSLVLAAMGVIELFNVAYRHTNGHGWTATLLIALVELAVAAALFITKDALYVTHISIIAGYALLRGVWEIYLGLRALTDRADQIIWTVSGVFGAILGFVILADPGRSQTTFVKMFGIYLAILGLASIVFAAHSRNSK
jgi:uncharacterized membrane protein HdeD (DUF308 family)